MSPDDVFAAQMWSWPDPMLKRDREGRVLYVNAAFLALYGGRVENWAGNPVNGWPAPNASGQPYRFETRGGAAPHEIIYDWVEVTMGDGHAMAIARDVTVFQQAPMPTPVQTPMQTPVQAPAQAPAQTSASASSLAPTTQPVEAPIAPSVSVEQPYAAEPIDTAQAPQSPETQATIAAPQIDVPEIDIPHIETPVIDAPQIQVPVSPAPDSLPIAPAAIAPQADMTPDVDRTPALGMPDAPQPDAPQPHAPQQEDAAPQITEPAAQVEPAAQTQERDFERRALPIENDEAVLGSNWRDAVIARAVGGAMAKPEEPEEEPDALPAPQASVSDAEPLRILLAEDNAINALLTRTLLEADGCVVETVEDGVLAVEAVKRNEYDLILMDMRMPNMDGLDATRKIRAMGGRRADNLPIIALTANAFDDDRNACFDSGMNDFMTKPVSAEELSAMVANWVAKSREKTDEKLAS